MALIPKNNPVEQRALTFNATIQQQESISVPFEIVDIENVQGEFSSIKGESVPVDENHEKPKTEIKLHLVYNSDGRISQVILGLPKNEADETCFKPNVTLCTLDLAALKALFILNLHRTKLGFLNAGLILVEIKQRGLFKMEHPTIKDWLSIECPRMGLSKEKARLAMNAAELFQNMFILLFQDQWGLTAIEVIDRFDCLVLLMPAYQRRRSLDFMKDAFIKGNASEMHELIYGKSFKSTASRNMSKASAVREANKAFKASLNIEEKRIVSCIEKYMIPISIFVRDVATVEILTRGLVGFRYRDSLHIRNQLQANIDSRSETVSHLYQIFSIAEMKILLIQYMAEGILGKLYCAIILNLLDTVPVLRAQWCTGETDCIHHLICREWGLDVQDITKLVSCGRNYSELEPLITAKGIVKTDVQFDKLERLDQAIGNHGSQMDLVLHHFFGEMSLADWNVFAQHRDYERLLHKSRIKADVLKKAQRKIALFRLEGEKGPQTTPTPGSLEGSYHAVLGVISEKEGNIVRKMILDSKFLNFFLGIFDEWQRGE